MVTPNICDQHESNVAKLPCFFSQQFPCDIIGDARSHVLSFHNEYSSAGIVSADTLESFHNLLQSGQVMTAKKGMVMPSLFSGRKVTLLT